MPPQPGQSSPVVSLSRQDGGASGSLRVGSLIIAYAMPTPTQPSAASGTAQRGARACRRSTIRVNRSVSTGWYATG